MTDGYQEFSTGEQKGLNLGNPSHFARRHLGLCDRNTVTTGSECAIVNKWVDERCKCVSPATGFQCCNRRYEEEGNVFDYCLACSRICEPVVGAKAMPNLGHYSKAITATVTGVLTILAYWLSPESYETVSLIIGTILTIVGVEQVPNKPKARHSK